MLKIVEDLDDIINDKLEALDAVSTSIPGVIIIHNIPDYTVRYMSPQGLDYFGVSLADLQDLGLSYYTKYFNKDDADDYIPKVAAMIANNDLNDFVSYFQQVRKTPDADWVWHFSVTKIFMRDEAGFPLLSITTSLPVDPLQHVTKKVERLLDENNFLRKNYKIFASLTERERTILSYLAKSLAAAEIADLLSISVHTVETHRKNLRKKLGVSTSFELNQYANAFDLI